MSRLSERPERPVVGEPVPHESAALHVTGRALYTDDLTPRTKLTTIRSVQQRLPELSHCGAIGEILGTFIDAAGQPVDHELNRSVIALPPSDLKAATNSLLVSGGQYKAEVVSAVLAAQYVNGLVTDEDVARFVLARHGG